MNYKFLIITLIAFSNSFAQVKQEVISSLENITSANQIDSLKITYPNWDINLLKTSSEGILKNKIIASAEIGETIILQNQDDTTLSVNKIVNRRIEEACKVQYIFFNGLIRNFDELDSLRDHVLMEFHQGASFDSLQTKYNEDGNPTGILDWFTKGLMVLEFDEAVRERNKDDIFKVDVPYLNWYYVVLKIEDNKDVEITESIRVICKVESD